MNLHFSGSASVRMTRIPQPSSCLSGPWLAFLRLFCREIGPATDNFRLNTIFTYLNFSIFKDIPQILSDAIVRTQILFSKVDRFLIAEDRCGIRLKEFLFDAHIMVGNRKHGRSILIRLHGHRGIILILVIIVWVALRIQSLRQHHLLQQDDSAHCVI